MSADWPIITLGEVCLKITDGAHNSPKSVAVGKPMASVKDLTRFGVDLSEARHISQQDYETLVRQGCRPEVGDVLIAKDGNSALDTVCNIKRPLDAVLLSSVAILRPDQNVVDSDFLKFFLSSKETIDYLKSNFISGAAIPRIVLKDFKKAKIKLPPLETQKDISAILNSVDDKIELNRQINQTLEQIAQAIFKSWFVDFEPVKAKIEAKQTLTPALSQREGEDIVERAAMCAISGKTDAELDQLPPEQRQQIAATAALFPDELVESELGLIPEGWEVNDVYSVADVIYGAPFASKKFNSDHIGKPLVRIRDLKSEDPDVYTPEVHPKGYLIQPGDIVVGMDGEFRAYLWGGEEAWLNQRVCVFKPKAGFSAVYVRCSIIPCLAAVESSETATTVIHLGKNDIDRFRVAIPKSRVMEAFGSVVDPIYSQLVSLKQSSRTLATLRDTLLPKLLSGELSTNEIQSVSQAANNNKNEGKITS